MGKEREILIGVLIIIGVIIVALSLTSNNELKSLYIDENRVLTNDGLYNIPINHAIGDDGFFVMFDIASNVDIDDFECYFEGSVQHVSSPYHRTTSNLGGDCYGYNDDQRGEVVENIVFRADVRDDLYGGTALADTIGKYGCFFEIGDTDIDDCYLHKCGETGFNCIIPKGSIKVIKKGEYSPVIEQPGSVDVKIQTCGWGCRMWNWFLRLFRS